MTTTPERWADSGIVRDRYVVNKEALAAWIKAAFNIQTRADAMRRVTDIDELAERIVIDGEAWRIPHECYLSLDLEPGDTRPQAASD